MRTELEAYIASLPPNAQLATLSRAPSLKTVLAKGTAFGRLTGEGWRPVDGTRDYFVIGLRAQGASSLYY